MQTTYTGKRVRIRPFRSGEEAYLSSVSVNNSLNPYWGEIWRPEQRIRTEFKNDGYQNPSGRSIFAVERIDGNELVGYEIGLPNRMGPLVGELATFIDEAHQKNGFGIEAKQLCLCYMFENFQLNQAWAVTLENHGPARRGLELSGMTHIGSMRKACFSEGEYRDTVVYRMLRREWEQHPIREFVRRGN